MRAIVKRLEQLVRRVCDLHDAMHNAQIARLRAKALAQRIARKYHLRIQCIGTFGKNAEHALAIFPAKIRTDMQDEASPIFQAADCSEPLIDDGVRQPPVGEIQADMN